MDVGTELFEADAESRNYGLPPITYTMTIIRGEDDFHIDPMSGKVVTSAPLDYSRTRSYLVCTDPVSVVVVTGLDLGWGLVPGLPSTEGLPPNRFSFISR